MRLIKMFGLAVMTAAAFSSLVGVGTAAAEIHEGIGFCKEEVLLLCPEAKLFTPSLVIKGTQEGTGEFTGGAFGTEKCTGGSSEGTVTEVDKKVLIIKNLKFAFTGCTPCTSVKVEEIAEAKLLHEGVNGAWVLEGSGGAKFEGCPLNVKCKFGGSEVKTLVEMGGGKAWVNTNGTALKLQEGSEFACGKEGHWFAKFNLTSGGIPIWPTLLELK